MLSRSPRQGLHGTTLRLSGPGSGSAPGLASVPRPPLRNRPSRSQVRAAKMTTRLTTNLPISETSTCSLRHTRVLNARRYCVDRADRWSATRIASRRVLVPNHSGARVKRSLICVSTLQWKSATHHHFPSVAGKPRAPEARRSEPLMLSNVSQKHIQINV